MKISIIIPIYNVSQFIERCLYSALNQTYPDVEYILVNDATTDNSMKIIAAIIANHPQKDRIKILHHPENRGLSAARNTGVRQATGDYVFFLDSDDEIVPDCIETLVAFVEKQAVDFVIGEIQVVGNQRKNYPPLRLENGIYLLENHSVLQSFLQKQWYEMAWNKLVKRSVFTEKNVWFEEGIVHEDTLWSFQLALAAQSMAVSQAQTYVYHIQTNSITQKKSKKNIHDFYFILEKMIRLATEENLFDAQKSIFKYWEAQRIYFIKTLLRGNFEKQYRKEQRRKIIHLYQTSVRNRRKRNAEIWIKDFILLLWINLKK